MRELSESSRLLEYYCLSEKAARRRWWKRHTYSATVCLVMPEQDLTIIVGSGKADAAEASWLLMGTQNVPTNLPRRLDMELLSEGKNGFLVRLVKRVFSDHSACGVHDVAEYVFRVPSGHPMVCEHDVWHQRELYRDITLTPWVFCDLVERFRTCHMLLGGSPIWIRSLYYRGVHRVGAKKEAFAEAENKLAG